MAEPATLGARVARSAALGTAHGVTELLPVLTLAQKWDLTADEVARNVFAHPTLSEAVKEAVEGLAGHMIHL